MLRGGIAYERMVLAWLDDVLDHPPRPRPLTPTPEEGNAAMADSLLLNPRTYDPAHFDAETRRLLRATVDWFEDRGKKALIDSYNDRAWYGDFLDFAAKEGLFATFLHPGRRRRRRRRQALGHRPHRRAQRDPRLLRPRLLVRLAGHRPRPRPGLAERQRRRPRPRRRAPRRGRT